MKKIFFLAMACIMAAVASAGEFNSMCFTSTDGGKHYISLSQLEITVSDGMLTATADEAQSLTFPLDQLQSMEFSSESPSVINEISAQKTGRVTAYDIKGMSHGNYYSVTEAAKSLSAGTYVIKSADGHTYKIIVK